MSDDTEKVEGHRFYGMKEEEDVEAASDPADSGDRPVAGGDGHGGERSRVRPESVEPK